MMQTDVRSVSVIEEGLAITGRTRIKGLIITFETSGFIWLYDSTTYPADVQSYVFRYVSGTTPGVVYVPFPGEGILCENGVFVRLSGTTATVFYG